MSKLRELKLKDVETLSSMQLMSASGSASGSGFPCFCKEDECTSHSDCGNDSSGDRRICMEKDCNSILPWCKRKVCRDRTKNERACNGLELGSICWIDDTPGKCARAAHGLTCMPGQIVVPEF